ncbi:ceramidase domain-containing protein [Microvirga puerhi]|uniref:Ceramidase domain-containing protein n=1 Tax=Microvirga puerhi TaxID=2876078 RepID=A0ABS7VT61_9HYPH|nr:ceramidase domain-containing protein [Microvirga puerhi]MBZ6078748.1 ceramidase domain-containing protein [Microvirga puerhi]
MAASWFAAVDNYCERIDASFWSEPLNAVTNAAFLVAAAYAFVRWRRAGGSDGGSLWLIVVTAIVGIGSFLFHTVAERWALLADVLPIAVFIYSYFLLAMRRYLGLGTTAAIAVTAAFVVFNMSFERLWNSIFPNFTLNGSVGYLPAAAALLVVGVLCLRKGEGAVGRALLAAACVFAMSLVFRSMDQALCPTLPIGTHFLWHILNAVVLGILMIAAITRGRGADR